MQKDVSKILRQFTRGDFTESKRVEKFLFHTGLAAGFRDPDGPAEWLAVRLSWFRKQRNVFKKKTDNEVVSLVIGRFIWDCKDERRKALRRPTLFCDLPPDKFRPEDIPEGLGQHWKDDIRITEKELAKDIKEIREEHPQLRSLAVRLQRRNVLESKLLLSLMKENLRETEKLSRTSEGRKHLEKERADRLRSIARDPRIKSLSWIKR